MEKARGACSLAFSMAWYTEDDGGHGVRNSEGLRGKCDVVYL